MVRSRMPVPSLLGLFGAFLVLSPAVVMGMSDGFTKTSLTDPGVQKALANAVELYNQDDHGPNYSKQLRIQEAWFKATEGMYHLKVEMVKTTCEKKANKIMNYGEIQKCEQLPGNDKKPTCLFTLYPFPESPPEKVTLVISACA